jgi:hypothetical protein
LNNPDYHQREIVWSGPETGGCQLRVHPEPTGPIDWNGTGVAYELAPRRRLFCAGIGRARYPDRTRRRVDTCPGL